MVNNKHILKIQKLVILFIPPTILIFLFLVYVNTRNYQYLKTSEIVCNNYLTNHPMNEWKTYSDVMGKFTFKYPKDWIYKDTPHYPTSPLIATSFTNENTYDEYYHSKKGFTVYIIRFNKYNPNKVTYIRELNIDGKIAFESDFIYEKYRKGYSWNKGIYFKDYELSFEYSVSNRDKLVLEENNCVLQKIVSTLKFNQ